MVGGVRKGDLGSRRSHRLSSCYNMRKREQAIMAERVDSLFFEQAKWNG